MINKMYRMLPFVRLGETLGKDVGAHVLGDLLDKVVGGLTKHLVEPMYVDSMSSAKMSHRGILSCVTDLYHSGVVFVKLHYDFPV